MLLFHYCIRSCKKSFAQFAANVVANLFIASSTSTWRRLRARGLYRWLLHRHHKVAGGAMGSRVSAGMFIRVSAVVASSISSFFQMPKPSGSRMINRNPVCLRHCPLREYFRNAAPLKACEVKPDTCSIFELF